MSAIATNKLTTLIFDLDGVITSEQKYWHTARLTVWELICSQNYLGIAQYFGESNNVSTRLTDVGNKVISSNFIYQLKSRAINSNWDLTFFVFCLHLVGILSISEENWSEILNQENISIENKLKQLGKLLEGKSYSDRISETIIKQFWSETSSLTGAAVLDHVNSFINQKLGINSPYFDAKGELWQLCYHNFQDWYEGKKGYILPEDETVLDLNSIHSVLSKLSNYTLAIATGRPRIEVIEPLTALGLLKYFDPKRIVTYDEVLEAESKMSPIDSKIKLGKPHPFILFKACYPDEEIEKLCAEGFELGNGKEIAYIGDAGSDVVAAKRAGCISIGVLTGFSEGKARENKRIMLQDKGCDVIVDSILDLPALLK